MKGASKGGLCPTEEPVLLYLYTTLKHTVLTLRKSHKVTKHGHENLLGSVKWHYKGPWGRATPRALCALLFNQQSFDRVQVAVVADHPREYQCLISVPKSRECKSHSRCQMSGMRFLIPVPIPKSWECNFSFPLPFPKCGNGLSNSRSESRKDHSRSLLNLSCSV